MDLHAAHSILQFRRVFFAEIRDDLITYAEKEFALNHSDDQGVSYRQTLEGLLKRTQNEERRAHYEDELAPLPFPISAMYLWKTYNRIRKRKGGNGFGISPIEWPDIQSFIQATRFPLLPWEVEVIEALDDVFRAAGAAKE